MTPISCFYLFNWNKRKMPIILPLFIANLKTKLSKQREVPRNMPGNKATNKTICLPRIKPVPTWLNNTGSIVLWQFVVAQAVTYTRKYICVFVVATKLPVRKSQEKEQSPSQTVSMQYMLLSTSGFYAHTYTRTSKLE